MLRTMRRLFLLTTVAVIFNAVLAAAEGAGGYFGVNGLLALGIGLVAATMGTLDYAEAFAKAAQSVAENTPRALETVAKWQGVQLLSIIGRISFS